MAFTSGTLFAADRSAQGNQHTGELLVHFKGEIDEPRARDFAAAYQLRFIALTRLDNAVLFACTSSDESSGRLCDVEAEQAASDPRVRLAYPNRRLNHHPRSQTPLQSSAKVGKRFLRDPSLRHLFNADLGLSARELVEPTLVGGSFSIEVSLYNRGPADARGLVLTVTPDPSLEFLGTGSSGCTGSGPIRCEVSELVRQGSTRIELAFRASSIGEFPTHLSLSSNRTDPNLADNNVSLNTTIVPSSANQQRPDLALSLNASPTLPVIGEELEYRISLVNQGAAVSGATLSLTTSGGFQTSALISDQGACTRVAPLSCEMAPIGDGGSAYVTLIGSPSQGGDLTITAAVEGPLADVDPSNNQRTLILTPQHPVTWNDPLFPNQWHLYKQNDLWGTGYVDINVMPAWSRGLFGEGVTVAVIDDGVELNHEDLRANTAAALSWDYNSNDPNPSHNRHGTAVAGLIGAAAGNGIGVMGVAPEVTLVGIRAENVTDYEEALALNHRLAEIDIYNNSWGPEDDGTTLEGPGPLTRAALEKGVTEGRDGKGVIYCWAGGNGGDNGDNSNFDGYSNSRYTLAFGAHSDLGFHPWYSELGANLIATAPSHGGFESITTTDRTGSFGYSSSGNYTSDFGGTSAATPIGCGITALMLEANPGLGWRDVHYIIAASAYKIDQSDIDWVDNGAGYPVNHKYGFGAVDADTATAMAEHWTKLGAEISVSNSREVNRGIPDGDRNGIDSSFTIDRDIYVESVEVEFSAPDHPYWGDLRITLTSPSGTKSVLAPGHESGRYSDFYENWTFLSKRHLGENGRGTWTLNVADISSDDSGSLTSWGLTLFGTEQPPLIPSTAGNSDLQLTGSLVESQNDLATLRLTARNNGPNSAANMIVFVTPPGGARLTSLTGTNSRCVTNPSPACSIGTLVPNQEVEIIATLGPAPVSHVEAGITGPATDPFPENNQIRIADSSDEPQIIEVPPHNLTLKLSGSGMGNISIDNPASNCQDLCQLTLPRGSEVTLRASPQNGLSRFEGWFGACRGSGDHCTFTLTDDLTVEAVFGFRLPSLFHWGAID
jgi:subtilisin-like proprotein convertase family protein